MAISNNQKTKDEMATVRLHLSIIILNVNGSPIKRLVHQSKDWWLDGLKIRSNYMPPPGDLLSFKEKHRLRVKGER